MNLELVRLFLIWCVGINYLVITLWFLVFTFAHDWLYRLHARWFKLSVEAFDLANYLGMAIYKVGVLLFLVAPLVALFFIP